MDTSTLTFTEDPEGPVDDYVGSPMLGAARLVPGDESRCDPTVIWTHPDGTLFFLVYGKRLVRGTTFHVRAKTEDVSESHPIVCLCDQSTCRAARRAAFGDPSPAAVVRAVQEFVKRHMRGWGAPSFVLRHVKKAGIGEWCETHAAIEDGPHFVEVKKIVPYLDEWRPHCDPESLEVYDADRDRVIWPPQT